MVYLSTDRLIEGVRDGRPLAPFPIDDDVLDTHIDLIRTTRMTLGTEAPEAQGLAALIKEPLTFVSEGRRNALNQCDLFVLPLPLCMAFSESFAGRPSIVIASGLVDLIASGVFASNIESYVPDHIRRLHLLKFRPDVPLETSLADALFLLRSRLYAFAEDPPNFNALMTRETLARSRPSIAGAVLFILLHELGHLTLGHLESDSVRPMRFEQTVEEGLSALQRQELEADDFALNSLTGQAKVLGTYWQHAAVDFFIQLEQVSGERYGEHPLGINRSYQADVQAERWGEELGVSARAEHFEGISRRFLETEKHVASEPNALLSTSREGCLRVLREIIAVLAEDGLDFSPLLTSTWPGWLNIYPDGAGEGFGQGGIP